MTDSIEQLLTLAAKLPSGLNDPQSANKLVAERAELLSALAQGDFTGALTEAADAAYYAVKHLDWTGRQVGVSAVDVMCLGIAK